MPYYPPRPDEEAPKASGKKPVIARIVLCVSLVLVAYGTIRLVSYGLDMISARKTTQEMRKIASATESAPPPEEVAPALTPAEAGAEETTEPAAAAALQESEPALSGKLPVIEYPNGYNVVPRIQKLRKKYPYIIGWITMDDLDEPVVQKDNTFFLDHDASGKRNVSGAIFMDEGTNLMNRPYTILLYGHNMKTGAMFGNLRKYEDPSYCFHHRIIRFDSLFEEGQYVIFAVTNVDLVYGKSRYVSLTDLQSDDIAARQDAVNALRLLSTGTLAPEVSAEDQLLLLITCTGDDDERLIVAARRLRENESADSPLL